MSINRILADGVTVFIIIVFLIGVVRFKSLSRELRFIFYFVAFGGVTELFADFYKAHIDKVTLPIGHFYLTFSILILCFFYFIVLKGFVNKWLLYLLSFSFLVFAIINPIFIQSLFEFPNFLGATGALIVVVFSIMLFSKIMVEAKIEKLWKEPLVWINSAILFYYSGNFFYFILFNINVSNSMEFARLTLNLYQLLNIFFYTIVGFIFLKTGKQKTLN